MKEIVRCRNCHHVFPVTRANVLPGKLREHLKERLREIEHELGGLRFHEGILFEQERTLRRELYVIREQLRGEAGEAERKDLG